MSRVPPQDMPAEQGVLGGVLSHGTDVLAIACDVLASEDFYDRRHARIFEAMVALFSKNEPVDEITVTSRLSANRHLDAIGGPKYLGELADIIISPSHVEHYAKLIVDAADARRFINATTTGIEKIYQGASGDYAEAIESVEADLFAVSDHREKGGPQLIRQGLMDTMKSLENKNPPGIKTGFDQLDELTNGLQDTDLIIVAGRPSMGKTALALQIGVNAAKNGVPTGVWSLEMGREQLNQRFISSVGRIPLNTVRSHKFQSHHWVQINEALDKLWDLPLYVDDTASLSVLQLRSRARRLAAQDGLGLVIVDYLQLMSGRANKDSSREQEISAISRGLKALAKELRVPVVALSQLNRKVEDRGGDKRPMLSDLRESGAIEQDADVIAFVYRKKVYKKKDELPEHDDNIAEVIIGKQRNGPTGTVSLVFQDEFTRFENRTPGYREAEEKRHSGNSDAP